MTQACNHAVYFNNFHKDSVHNFVKGEQPEGRQGASYKVYGGYKEVDSAFGSSTRGECYFTNMARVEGKYAEEGVKSCGLNPFIAAVKKEHREGMPYIKGIKHFVAHQKELLAMEG